MSRETPSAKNRRQKDQERTLHLTKATLWPDLYPTKELYPFNQPLFHETREIVFRRPVTFFAGENGTGKSTLLEAIALQSGIHIWQDEGTSRVHANPYERALCRYLSLDWTNGRVPGSFFSSELFRHFSQYLDEWAASDPEMLKYFGGKSLTMQSHGQSLMSFFRVRYKIKGIYLLDEPETALSPKSQLELLRVLKNMGEAGHAQFIVASHSPILLACPGADIYSFDRTPIAPITYEQTEHYRIYEAFMRNRETYLSASG